MVNNALKTMGEITYYEGSVSLKRGGGKFCLPMSAGVWCKSEGAPAKKLRGCSSKSFEHPIYFFMGVNKILVQN